MRRPAARRIILAPEFTPSVRGKVRKGAISHEVASLGEVRRHDLRTGVVLDSAGNLYGTAYLGGALITMIRIRS